jgi:hypothetical protein
VVKGQVKIMSAPSGATVWIDGKEIGRTETLPLEQPIGPIEIVLKHPEYRETIYRGTVKEGFQLYNVRLLPDLGPIPGNPWINSIGIPFHEEAGGVYETDEPVSMQAFDLFLSESGRAIPVSGFQGVAQVRDESALYHFADWMTEKDRERGFLGRDEYHRPVRPVAGSGDAFHCRIDDRFGTLLLNSEPEGAMVTVNGVAKGVTPLTLNDVRLGPFEVAFDAPGFEERVETGILEGTEAVALVTELSRDGSLVFGEPWTNSQGMRLVPIGNLMVATFETRVSDYREFVTESRLGFMPDAGFSQALNHPVAGVTREEAERFCVWLTQREQERESIRPGQRYRLPTDLEWSRFTGEDDAAGSTPEERGRGGRGAFPWGTNWPPQEDVGNLADLAAASEFGQYVIEGYNDGFAATAPVGSFDPAGNGLHDLCGNVWEWVRDPFNGEESGLAVVRGGGWNSHEKDVLRISYRNAVPADARQGHLGFRYVLEETAARP